MNGRKLFKLTKPFLIAMAYFLKIFPQGIRNWFWQLSDLLPRIIAVGFRWSIAHASGVKLGNNVYFGQNVTIKHWKKLTIGNNVSVHENCFIDADGEVLIGSEVSIAHAVSLISFDHDFSSDGPIKYAPLIKERITIGNNVWISAGVRVLRGASINSKTVIAANAVVRGGEIEGCAVYGGVPIRKLKEIS